MVTVRTYDDRTKAEKEDFGRDRKRRAGEGGGGESIKPVIIIYGQNIYGLSFHKLPFKIMACYIAAVARAISQVKEGRERETETERVRSDHITDTFITFNSVVHSTCTRRMTT